MQRKKVGTVIFDDVEVLDFCESNARRMAVS